MLFGKISRRPAGTAWDIRNGIWETLTEFKVGDTRVTRAVLCHLAFYCFLYEETEFDEWHLAEFRMEGQETVGKTAMSGFCVTFVRVLDEQEKRMRCLATAGIRVPQSHFSGIGIRGDFNRSGVAWIKDGKLHREGDEPAFICDNGARVWMKEGKFYRKHGPAYALS